MENQISKKAALMLRAIADQIEKLDITHCNITQSDEADKNHDLYHTGYSTNKNPYKGTYELNVKLHWKK